MISIDGPSFDDLDPQIEACEKLVMKLCKQIMDEVASQVGHVKVAAAEPVPPPQEPPGESAVSLDTLALIATLWATVALADLIPFIGSIWDFGARKTRRQIDKAVPSQRSSRMPTIGDPATRTLAEDYLANAPNRVSVFSDDMWKIARAQLLEGFMEGESIDKLRDRLRLNVPKLSAPRARTIARTEVISASNAGSLAMVELGGFTGKKGWLATEDERTRPTHRQAEDDYHDSPIPLGDAFVVGGFPLHFPGDPTGPPEEIINCRCTMTYELEDEPLTAAGGDMAGEWIGVLALEGVCTGDGRMFSPESLTWAQLPVPLMWQEKTGEGHEGSVIVGNITSIARVGNQIMGRGTFDLSTEDGMEAYDRVKSGYLKGVSIDADSFSTDSVEYVYSDGEDDAQVSLVIFHSARIRGATLCALPAFSEAFIQAMPGIDMPLTAAAIKGHDTSTSDKPWDKGTNLKRLDSPMPVATARAMFAWMDDSQVKDGKIVKDACKFPHHEVSADGTPGAANLEACSAGVAALHGARGGTDIPQADKKGVYAHLAGHLKDAGRTPPKFGIEDSLTAAAYILTIPDVPPVEWFQEPTDVDMSGALTVTDEGRVYGYLAPAGVAHRSFKDRVTVPMGNVDYSLYMGRETLVAGGGRIITGALTMDCGHASTGFRDPTMAMDHYDNSFSIVATVRIGECTKGVWVAGSLVPGLSANQVSRIMACQLSGDWRPHRDKSGWREFAGALLVPVPGFAMTRTEASVRVEEGALVASTVPVQFVESDYECGCSAPASGLASDFESLAASLGLDLSSRMQALVTSVEV